MMNKLKTFALKKPILFSLLLMAFALIALYMPTEKLYYSFFDMQYSTFLGELTNNLVLGIILVVVLMKLDLIKSIGLTAFPSRWKDWLVAWPLMVVLLIGLLPLLSGDVIIDTSKPLMTSIFILMNFLIGLAEELLVRGVILGVLLLKWGNTKNGIMMCVIVSSVIFGGAHIGNFIADPDILVATLSQLIYATFIGMFFAALVIRSQTIWIAIILHGAIDFFGQLQQIAVGGGIEAAKQAAASTTLSQAMAPIIIYFMLASYAFFILKKATPEIIQAKFTNNIHKSGNINVANELFTE